MRRSITAVISKNETFNTDFCTEPYECAWAGEARWFIRVLGIEGNQAELVLRSQISPDGLFWCDGDSKPIRITGTDLYSLGDRNFGGWLRLKGSLAGTDALFKLMIYLVLKE